jgi:hypothetical protein
MRGDREITRARPSRLVLAIAVVVAALTGCGSDSEDGVATDSRVSRSPSTSTTTRTDQTTTTVRPDVLGWVRAHRDDYRALVAVAQAVSPAVDDALLGTPVWDELEPICKSILPAAGNLQLDLPTTSDAVDQQITAGLKAIRSGSQTCLEVADILGGAPIDYAVFGATRDRALSRLDSGLAQIRGALVSGGVPKEAL